MTDFTLDTSSYVAADPVPWLPNERPYYWPDLSPFEQGYTREMLAELQRQRWALYRASCAQSPGHHLPVPIDPAYSWIAPETLAAIRKDCAHYERLKSIKVHPGGGGAFWRGRQNGTWPKNFPPLTVSLNDAGKVVFS